ncbi:hypothetical protein [Shewanella algae]|uniref:hypothetical protein n=1 Tax=Shewanella algae TaxID=38313 RepID=UPI001AADC696|nr:hypothetical protein [Shewanella algae]MBO2658108.1 hypothetical protein [Shewanella algae]
MNILEFKEFTVYVSTLRSDRFYNSLAGKLKSQKAETESLLNKIRLVLDSFSRLDKFEALLYPVKIIHNDESNNVTNRSEERKEINILSLLSQLNKVNSPSPPLRRTVPNNNWANLVGMIIYYHDKLGFDNQNDEIEVVKSDIQDLREKLSLIRNQFNDIRTVSNQLAEQLKSESELQKIQKSKLNRIQLIQEQVEAIKNEAALNLGDLKVQKKTTDEILEANHNASKYIKENESLYNELQGFYKNISLKNDDFIKSEKEYNDSIANIKVKTDELQEIEDYLKQLTDVAVGAKLFETFKQRKEELTSTINFWKWAVPITVVLSIIWIVLVFSLNSSKDMTWFVILISSIKSIPALFLMYFSISQFTKERNFQEEYAFKSTVALTIKAYVDQVNDNNNKDKVIIDSLSEIYKSPVIYRNTRNTEVELIKDSKNDVLDIVKKLLDSKKS